MLIWNYIKGGLNMTGFIGLILVLVGCLMISKGSK